MLTVEEVNKAYTTLAQAKRNHAEAGLALTKATSELKAAETEGLAAGSIINKTALANMYTAVEVAQLWVDKTHLELNIATSGVNKIRLELDIAALEVERLRTLLRLQEIAAK